MTDEEIQFETILGEVMDRCPLGPGHFLYGPNHWYRVETIGLRIARANGADKTLLRLFALLHDAMRSENPKDTEHGPASVKLVEEFQGKYYDLDDERYALLVTACRDHAKGETSDDVTIGTCWDADRLDQARFGAEVDRDLLSTDEAKDDELYEWATQLYLRSQP